MGIFQYQTMINVATKNLNKMNLFSGNKFLTIQWNILLPAKVTEKTYLYIGVSGESYIMVKANSIKEFSGIIKPNRNNIKSKDGFIPSVDDKKGAVEGKGTAVDGNITAVDGKRQSVDD